MNCDWQPAHNVYTGTAKAAIMSYTDIPLAIRKTLIERTTRNDYDDIIEIRRDSISGRNQYEPNITRMHFGSKGKVCQTINLARWSERDRQSAMVYCEGSYCVARPSVCNNWARVVRSVAEPKNKEQSASDSYVESSWDDFGPLYDAEERADSSSFGPIYADDAEAFAETVPGVRSFSDSVSVSGVSYGSQGGDMLAGPAGTWIAPPTPLPVLLSPIPEPSTWLCMLAGLGLLAGYKLKGKAK